MLAKLRQFTPEEYLLIERRAEFKSEYIDGMIYAMAGASPNHNVIASNVIAELHIQLRPTPCLVFPSDMKVRIPDRRKYLYPDVSVICGKGLYADNQRDVLLNPLLVVEILSESTSSHDRTRKFLWYQQIETLEEYVLISQDEPLVETFRRQADGSWAYAQFAGPDTTLTLPSVNCTIPLKNIYAKVEFDASDVDATDFP